MDAAIVELDSLSDPIGSAAEDHDFSACARVGLAFRLVEPVALVAGIHVWGQRRKLGGAGVDTLVYRPQIKPTASGRYRLLVDPGEACQPRIGKSHLL